jgi:serine/threonine protein kinase/formylglycine-generating enzyme required for sulfatase activity
MEILNKYIYDPQTDLLGKGGFATVYKAFDKILEMPVALKFFHPQDQANKYTIINEIKRAILLSHPNIVKYYGVETLTSQNFHGQTEEMQIGVMEYVQEGQFKSYMNNNSVTTDELKKLLIDILLGLQYLHSEGIIHRDIKPQNILLGRDKQNRLVAKIADFGISKAADSNQASASLLLGTIEYMAPEQFNPERYGINKKISYNVDVWAFGVTAYYLLTGDLLFGSRSGDTSAAQLINKIVHADGLDQKLNSVDEPFRSMLLKCVVPDANQRTNDFDDLVAILRAGQIGGKSQSYSFSSNKSVTPSGSVIPPAPVQSTAGDETMNIPKSAIVDDGATQEIKLPPKNTPTKSKPVIEDDGATQEIKFDKKGNVSSPSFNQDEATVVNDISEEITEKKKNKSLVWIILAVIVLGGGGYFGYTKFVAKDEPATEKGVELSEQDAALKQIGDNLISITGGEFTMGTNEYQGDAEKPPHKVTVGNFLLSKFEVTKGDWNKIMKDNKFKDSTAYDFPADEISWNDAKTFIAKLNTLLIEKRKTDANFLSQISSFKLPSEAEWEYTALKGKSPSAQLNDVSWNVSNANKVSHKVGTKTADGNGIYDMMGNLYEWCEDWYGPYLKTPTQEAKILRGGDFENPVELVDSKVRNAELINKKSKNIGFRIAADGSLQSEQNLQQDSAAKHE